MAKDTDEDVMVLARHLILMEAIREIEERPGGYPSERKTMRKAAVREYMEHLPAVREILTREKR